MNAFQKENNFLNYLEKIKGLRGHIVVLAVKDTIGMSVKETGYSALRELGLQKVSEHTEPRANHWRGYAAIIDDQKVVYEKLAETNRSVSVEQRVEGIELEVFSSPLNGSNLASIIVDGGEYAVNGRGINIVIVNAENRQIVDSVCFDTHVGNAACIRRTEDYEITILPRERSTYFIRDIDRVKNSLKIDELIPDFHISRAHNTDVPSKIKVRIYFGGAHNLWIDVESVARCFAADERYDCLVVIEDAKVETINAVCSSGIRWMGIAEYNLQQDRADIGIYNCSRMLDKFPDREEKIKCYLPFGLIYGSKNRFADALKGELIRYGKSLDAVIVDRVIYRGMDGLVCPGTDKLFEFGNPKFDLIYRYVNQGEGLPERWEKIKGKKVILWAFDHIWNSANCTFDLYIRPFLDYFAARTDIALIIRPHISYVIEMFDKRIWTGADYAALKEFCDSTPNILWDDSRNYGHAYSAASAVITDVNCGITVSALTLDVPLAVLYRYDGYPAIPQNPELVDCLYSLHNVEEAYAFIDAIVAGEDSKKERRRNIFDQYVTSFDGKNGKRIKEFIEKLYEKKRESKNLRKSFMKKGE